MIGWMVTSSSSSGVRMMWRALRLTSSQVSLTHQERREPAFQGDRRGSGGSWSVESNGAHAASGVVSSSFGRRVTGQGQEDVVERRGSSAAASTWMPICASFAVRVVVRPGIALIGAVTWRCS